MVKRKDKSVHFRKGCVINTAKKKRTFTTTIFEGYFPAYPFLIGSIEDVNKKISHLDRKLQTYTELIIESRSSDHDDEYRVVMPPSSANCRDRVRKKDQEKKDMDRFAGVFSIQSMVGLDITDRVKNISKISMQPSKTTVTKKEREKTAAGKPRFVELHQYPGYDPNELTPLPHNIPPTEILEKTAKAQLDLRKKPQYKVEFEHMFYSQMSQAILQDLFWWFFCEKYQQNAPSQRKLFNRIAHNFVKLITYNKHPFYKDVFLKSYPELLAQAVYAAFCEAFPDSYRQFQSDFREDLLILVYEWFTGVKPKPRSSFTWNFAALEPKGIKSKSEMLQRASKENKSASKDFNMDWIESMTNQTTDISSATPSVQPTTSQISFASKRSARVTQPIRKNERPIKGDATPLQNDGIKEVVDAQKTPISSLKSPLGKPPMLNNEPQETQKGLAPISEENPVDETELEPSSEKEKKSEKLGMTYSTLFNKKQKSKPESHPACRGPDFVRTVFNVYGQSPLVAHFMRMKKIPQDGYCLKVQRTEMENLPSLDHVTYRDIIKESFKNVREIEAKYNELHKKGSKDAARFVREQRRQMKEHMKKEAQLLANPKEVKRICDILLLERKPYDY